MLQINVICVGYRHTVPYAEFVQDGIMTPQAELSIAGRHHERVDLSTYFDS